ncbi:hypothetical protein L7F22_068378 [Adiantum nelumboides]|nr:hypothetical protein [Adiantum nelumboides]
MLNAKLTLANSKQAAQIPPQGSDPEDYYVKQNRIGKGSFGEVYKGFSKITRQPVAIKIIDLENAEDEIDDIQQEIAILSQLDSDFVTKYHGSWLKGTNLWIVMEYCSGGSCSDLMKPGKFREDYIAIVLRELLKGLDYLHGEGKLHRDIKAANVLLSSSGDVKLADFGVSGQLTATMTKKNTHRIGDGRTAVRGSSPDEGALPHPKNPPPQLDSGFSKTFREFVSYCLQRDPAARPTAKELLKHRFIRNAKKTTYLTELIERLERWRAEGGDGGRDDDSDRRGQEPAAEEDDWDFGTVRHPTMRGGGAPVHGLQATRQAPPQPNIPPVYHDAQQQQASIVAAQGTSTPTKRAPAPNAHEDTTPNGKQGFHAAKELPSTPASVAAARQQRYGSPNVVAAGPAAFEANRYGSVRSVSSGGSGSASGTVRLGAAAGQRGALPMQGQHSASSSSGESSVATPSYVQGQGSGYGEVRTHIQTSSELDQDNEVNGVVDAALAKSPGGGMLENGVLASYERAANPERRLPSDDDDALLGEDDRLRLEQMNLHGRDGSESIPTPARDAAQNQAAAAAVQGDSLFALDAVLLPVLDQRPDAQQSIEAIRQAFEHAEAITPGLMNAFAVEVYHGMIDAQSGGQEPLYEVDEEEEEDEGRRY